ncbi:hypothetical protein LSAT2_010110 [Lamellibrachia satsuma]|nr:hypothetical protein LSAT2_010110 [Lamellibrachia satsuma]
MYIVNDEPTHEGIDITEDNLEDLLTYDDLFLDYFNAFLALPVFPQALWYNRLTSTFLEVEGINHTLSCSEVSCPSTPPYGATDEERDAMLEWAREERLPFFLKTQLFREFKLCKLLLRPLDDRSSARCSSSRQLRGYSRQTESYISSLGNTVDNSANDADFEEYNLPWGDIRRSALYRYQRPGSRAFSLPAKIGLGHASQSLSGETKTSPSKETSESSNKNIKHPPTPPRGKKKEVRQDGKPSKIPVKLKEEVSIYPAQDYSTGEMTDLSTTHGRYHKRSALKLRKATPKQCLAIDNKMEADSDSASNKSGEMEEDDDDVVEPYVAFGSDVVSDQQTESDMKQLENKHKMSLQQMKEQIIGSVKGVRSLEKFLRGTAGGHLYDFWLDCERFKDQMVELDENDHMAMRNTLFRDIQDKYNLQLTADAKKQIAHATSIAGLGHTVFIRTQYDVLRRIRAYWVPRFLLHKERMDELRTELRNGKGDVPSAFGLDMSSTFFPSISLVNSMPVRPEDVMQIARTRNWDVVCTGGRRLDDRIKSAKVQFRSMAMPSSLRAKLVFALDADRHAGSPFKAFLHRQRADLLLSNMLFWEDVADYGAAEARFSDRLLRMNQAWSIFNKYLAVGSKNSIGCLPRTRDNIHRSLLTNRDFVSVVIFDEMRENAVDLLLNSWLRYLKEDLKTFIDCHMRMIETPPGSADEFEVILDDDERLVVRRHARWVQRYPPSTGSERGRRLRSALSMAESIDDERRMEQRQIAKEKRRIMMKERRKAIRAAKQRLKDAKMKKSVKFEKTEEKTEQLEPVVEQEPEPEVEPEEEDKVATFQESVSKKSMMTLFKKFIQENEGKEALNLLSLYLDIEVYHHMATEGKSKKQRDTHATFIYKTYLNQGSRKKVLLSEKAYTRLRQEKDRPKTPTLKESQQHILPQLEQIFSNFMEMQTEEMGIDGKNFANMSKAELAMHSDDPSTLTAWSRKKKGRQDWSTGGALADAPALCDIMALLSNVSAELLKYVLGDADYALVDGGKLTHRQLSNLSSSSDFMELHPGEQKPDGREQPTKEEKMEFLVALNNSVVGHMPLQMMYFYKYLVFHGEQNKQPLIDRDLFYYWEVQKFKDCNHVFADQEMLKRKVRSLLDSYLDCTPPPTLQVDMTTELQQKSVRAAQKFLAGKEMGPLFDESQLHVFKELLPYWAGFIREYEEPEDPTLIPLTKKQLERLRRLQLFDVWKPPSAKLFSLPSLPKGATVTSLSFSLTEGIQWQNLPLESSVCVGSASSVNSDTTLHSSLSSMSYQVKQRRSPRFRLLP